MTEYRTINFCIWVMTDCLKRDSATWWEIRDVSNSRSGKSCVGVKLTTKESKRILWNYFWHFISMSQKRKCVALKFQVWNECAQDIDRERFCLIFFTLLYGGHFVFTQYYVPTQQWKSGSLYLSTYLLNHEMFDKGSSNLDSAGNRNKYRT